MIIIVCPNCGSYTELPLADWEEFSGNFELGKATRISLVCNKCRQEFLLTASLSQVITG